MFIPSFIKTNCLVDILLTVMIVGSTTKLSPRIQVKNIGLVETFFVLCVYDIRLTWLRLCQKTGFCVGFFDVRELLSCLVYW
jgi:hypothetical protein